MYKETIVQCDNLCYYYIMIIFYFVVLAVIVVYFDTKMTINVATTCCGEHEDIQDVQLPECQHRVYKL